MKNTLDRIKGKLDIAKEKVCKPENTAIEIIQNERQGEKRKKVKTAPVSHGTISSSLICVIGKRRRETKKII